HDCDGNGIADACDIAAGRSTDADGDGIPDQCDSALPEDLDANGIVGAGDLGILLGAWGACPTRACRADLDDSGDVNAADLGMLLGAWDLTGDAPPTCPGAGRCCEPSGAPGCAD